MTDLKNISLHLMEKGIHPSFQRVKIFEYLLKNKNHPTAGMIFNELSDEIPTLSKTTVYNTIKIFSSKKLISILTINENEIRFDADTSKHGHFYCNQCGKIFDCIIDLRVIEPQLLSNFAINEQQTYFKGECKSCSENSKQKQKSVN